MRGDKGFCVRKSLALSPRHSSVDSAADNFTEGQDPSALPLPFPSYRLLLAPPRSSPPLPSRPLPSPSPPTLCSPPLLPSASRPAHLLRSSPGLAQSLPSLPLHSPPPPLASAHVPPRELPREGITDPPVGASSAPRPLLAPCSARRHVMRLTASQWTPALPRAPPRAPWPFEVTNFCHMTEAPMGVAGRL